jgi:hypothetical protein
MAIVTGVSAPLPSSGLAPAASPPPLEQALSSSAAETVAAAKPTAFLWEIFIDTPRCEWV